MNATSRIQAAAPPAALPVSSSSEIHAPGGTIFREAMHQAMGPSKHADSASSHSLSLTHAASPAARAPESGTPQAPQNKAATVGSGEVQPSDSAPAASAATGSAGPVSGASTGSDMQSTSVGESVNGKDLTKSLAVAVSITADGSDPNAVGTSADPAVKNPRADDKNSDKNFTQAQFSAGQAPASIAASAVVPVALLPTTPIADSSTGTGAPQGAPAKIPGAANGNANGIVSSAAAKQTEIASTQSALPLARGDQSAIEPEASHRVTRATANAVGNSAHTITPASRMTTTISSTGLLLSPADGTPSLAAHASSNSGDAKVDPTAGGSLGGIAPFAGNLSSKPSGPQDSSPSGIGNPGTAAVALAAAHVEATGHAGPSDMPPAAQPSGGQTTLPMGNISNGHAGTSAAMSIGPSNAGNSQQPMTASATFSAMDRADSGPAGFLLHAAPHQVAVGVTDPGLGWIEVRAERVAGQVTAALTANSAASHAELASVLPAMSSYLTDHQHTIHQIHVETGFTPGQNPADSKNDSSSRQQRNGSPTGRIGGISGVGDGSRIPAAKTGPIADHATESALQRTRLEDHQFSVRA